MYTYSHYACNSYAKYYLDFITDVRDKLGFLNPTYPDQSSARVLRNVCNSYKPCIIWLGLGLWLGSVLGLGLGPVLGLGLWLGSVLGWLWLEWVRVNVRVRVKVRFKVRVRVRVRASRT